MSSTLTGGMLKIELAGAWWGSKCFKCCMATAVEDRTGQAQ
jgi:hypothetical protein